jgi:hypothetical protein
MEEIENRKRKRFRTKKRGKGSHWADPGTEPAQQPFLPLSFSFSFLSG